jgi:hypothetical protein
MATATEDTTSDHLGADTTYHGYYCFDLVDENNNYLEDCAETWRSDNTPGGDNLYCFGAGFEGYNNGGGTFIALGGDNTYLSSIGPGEQYGNPLNQPVTQTIAIDPQQLSATVSALNSKCPGLHFDTSSIGGSTSYKLLFTEEGVEGITCTPAGSGGGPCPGPHTPNTQISAVDTPGRVYTQWHG